MIGGYPRPNSSSNEEPRFVTFTPPRSTAHAAPAAQAGGCFPYQW